MLCSIGLSMKKFFITSEPGFPERIFFIYFFMKSAGEDDVRHAKLLSMQRVDKSRLYPFIVTDEDIFRRN